ncbi:type II toxin-antitoxin system VapC family toxin [Endobacterium cereale]|uniref:type II toxin-antitoxin system VapC family toxin n=1 Tax=Endobacterium cereale TaxID=2663029 RepID=UPI002B45F0AB|nr:type II toxin-antitoxin system VapC family toxin [Endobacterium cereale]MEB2843130.1 type II toxin-antitoxin system VapC family toxin [Endobacterium cereale]
MYYVDTSALIALLVGEPTVDIVSRWMAHHRDERLFISEWTYTEFSSALSVKARVEKISPSLRKLALGGFLQMANNSLEVAPVFSRHFKTAAHLADHIELGLRSGDALHLAVAMELDAGIVTLDKRFATAAQTLGARCTLL